MAMCFLQRNGDVFSTVQWRYVFYSLIAMCFLQSNGDVFSEVSEFSGMRLLQWRVRAHAQMRVYKIVTNALQKVVFICSTPLYFKPIILY